MRFQSFRIRTAVAIVVVGGLLAACGGGDDTQPAADTRAAGPASTAGKTATPPSSAALRDLPDLGALRQAFNDAAGKPRLILLLSPT
jgi:hypothetical protein